MRNVDQLVVDRQSFIAVWEILFKLFYNVYMSINYFSEKMKFLFCAINMVKQLHFLIGISCSYHIQSVMSMERHWYKRHCKFQCRKFIVARTSFLFLLDHFCNQSFYNHNTFQEQIFSTAASNSCFSVSFWVISYNEQKVHSQSHLFLSLLDKTTFYYTLRQIKDPWSPPGTSSIGLFQLLSSRFIVKYVCVYVYVNHHDLSKTDKSTHSDLILLCCYHRNNE